MAGLNNMPLAAFVGEDYSFNMGNLKTYNMTKFLYEDFKNNREIYANYTLKYLEYTHIYGLHELIDMLPTMNNCTIAIDELGVWWDCYEKPSKDNGTSDLKDFSRQVRKRGVKLNYTAQSFFDIPNALRKVTQYIYRCRKLHTDFTLCTSDECYKEHIAELTPMFVSTSGYMLGKPTFFKVDVNIYNIYDTYEIISNCEVKNNSYF